MFGSALTLILALASSAVIASPAVNNVHKHAVASLNPASTVLPFHFPESVYENTPIQWHLSHVKNGEVTSFSSSFGTAQHFAKSDLAVSAPKATVDFEKASATASAQLGIPVYSEFEHVLECGVMLTTGKVIQAVDFANKASYKVIPVPRRDVTEGIFNVVKLPRRPEMVYSTPKFNGDDEPGTDDNVAASAVNLFYISNLMHDITYQYGFTEKAGNFQKDNFGKGGRGNDAVVVNVLTPPEVTMPTSSLPSDGHRSDEHVPLHYTTPSRSGGLDNGIAIHEYGHGVSNRLTGGSATGGCLSTDEAGGMGEGWSDIMALIVLAKSSDTATTSIPMGAHATLPSLVPVMLSLLLMPPTTRVPTSARSSRHLPSVVSAPKATSNRKNDFSIPSECDGDAPPPRETTTARKTRTTTATDKKTKTTTTTDRKTKTTTAKKTKTTTTTTSEPEPTEDPNEPEPTEDPTEPEPTDECDITDICCFFLGHYCD
ncbi:hypothetical protein BASA62_003246 [Batrachochytrium salamandrivorans]|nr:hypothetical protein BASA62_003246 [Batrachochytrium salamandrivorans]